MTKTDYLIIVGVSCMILLGLQQLQQLAYSWPAGTTEEQKNKIKTVTSDDDLTRLL